LRQIARVIDTHARRPLDCTARYGGEEFVGLWYGLDEAQMLAILQDIRQDTEALGLSHAYSDTASVVTLSIGMAYLTPQPQQCFADALQLADAALYQAKQQGHNCVVSRSFADQGHALR
jgi:diguanylate cyclase (GGDEF)-like protein